MLSKSNIRLQKSATEASIFYYIVSEEISLFRLSPQSAFSLVRLNKLPYILSHFFLFDNLSFFTFQGISHLFIFQTFFPICLWKKVKSQAMPHSQPFGLFHGRLAPYKTAKINAPASKLAERYFYCFAWLVA